VIRTVYICDVCKSEFVDDSRIEPFPASIPVYEDAVKDGETVKCIGLLETEHICMNCLQVMAGMMDVFLATRIKITEVQIDN
jgi:DNA-directed RNA polymerase subunit RPC12/RpoP